MQTPQDAAMDAWGGGARGRADAAAQKRERVESLSFRCTDGWSTYSAAAGLQPAGGHPRLRAWLESCGFAAGAGTAGGAGSLVWAERFVAGWVTGADGKQERTRAPAVLAPVQRVVRGKLSPPPHAVWACYGGADDRGRDFSGRVVTEGLVAEGNGWVELCAWPRGEGERILLVTDDPRDALALSAATGLAAWAWNGEFDALRLPDEGRMSVGPRPYQVRAVVLCGSICRWTGGDGARAAGLKVWRNKAHGPALRAVLNGLLSRHGAAADRWDGGRLQAAAVVPTPELLAPGVLERGGEGDEVRIRTHSADGEAVKGAPERVGWWDVWRHNVALVGVEEARRVVSAAVLGVVADRAMTRWAPPAAAWAVGTGETSGPGDAGARRGGGGDTGGGGGPGGWSGGAGEGRGGDGRWCSAVTQDSMGRLIMPAAVDDVAKEFIWSHLVRRDTPVFVGRPWGGKFWMNEGAAWVELEASAEECRDRLAAQVMQWLSQPPYYKRKRAGAADAAEEEDLPVVRFAPTMEFCRNVVAAVYGLCWTGELERLPVYIPADLTDDGDPQWGAATRLFGQAQRKAAASVGRPRPSDLVVAADGMVDMARVAETGEVRLLGHAADLFNTTALPYDMPVAELQAALDVAADLDAAEADAQEQMEEARRSEPDRVPVLEAALAESAKRRLKALDGVFTAAAPHAWPFLKGLASRVSAPGAEPVIDYGKLNLICEVLGHAVDKDRSLEKIPLFVGKRRAGKDTLADLICGMVGDRNVAELTVSTFDDRYGLFCVVGKLVAMVREMHKGSRNDGTSFVEGEKLLSGNSRIGVRDLYRSFVFVRPGVFLINFANDLPTGMRDQSGAWAGRLIPIKLHRNYYGREDGRVKQQVAADGRGALVVALYHAVRLRRKPVRRFDECEESTRVRLELERISAAVAAFVADCCTVGPDQEEPFPTLYDAYCWYCSEQGQTPKNKGNFSALLETHVPDFARKQEGAGARRGKIVGISLTAETVEEIEQARRERARTQQVQSGSGSMWGAATE